jgi:hypothetical protein
MPTLLRTAEAVGELRLEDGVPHGTALRLCGDTAYCGRWRDGQLSGPGAALHGDSLLVTSDAWSGSVDGDVSMGGRCDWFDLGTLRGSANGRLALEAIAAELQAAAAAAASRSRLRALAAASGPSGLAEEADGLWDAGWEDLLLSEYRSACQLLLRRHARLHLGCDGVSPPHHICASLRDIRPSPPVAHPPASGVAALADAFPPPASGLPSPSPLPVPALPLLCFLPCAECTPALRRRLRARNGCLGALWSHQAERDVWQATAGPLSAVIRSSRALEDDALCLRIASLRQRTDADLSMHLRSPELTEKETEQNTACGPAGGQAALFAWGGDPSRTFAAPIAELQRLQRSMGRVDQLSLGLGEEFGLKRLGQESDSGDQLMMDPSDQREALLRVVRLVGEALQAFGGGEGGGAAAADDLIPALQFVWVRASGCGGGGGGGGEGGGNGGGAASAGASDGRSVGMPLPLGIAHVTWLRERSLLEGQDDSSAVVSGGGSGKALAAPLPSLSASAAWDAATAASPSFLGGGGVSCGLDGEVEYALTSHLCALTDLATGGAAGACVRWGAAAEAPVWMRPLYALAAKGARGEAKDAGRGGEAGGASGASGAGAASCGGGTSADYGGGAAALALRAFASSAPCVLRLLEGMEPSLERLILLAPPLQMDGCTLPRQLEASPAPGASSLLIDFDEAPPEAQAPLQIDSRTHLLQTAHLKSPLQIGHPLPPLIIFNQALPEPAAAYPPASAESTHGAAAVPSEHTASVHSSDGSAAARLQPWAGDAACPAEWLAAVWARVGGAGERAWPESGSAAGGGGGRVAQGQPGEHDGAYAMCPPPLDPASLYPPPYDPASPSPPSSARMSPDGGSPDLLERLSGLVASLGACTQHTADRGVEQRRAVQGGGGEQPTPFGAWQSLGRIGGAGERGGRDGGDAGPIAASDIAGWQARLLDAWRLLLLRGLPSASELQAAEQELRECFAEESDALCQLARLERSCTACTLAPPHAPFVASTPAPALAPPYALPRPPSLTDGRVEARAHLAAAVGRSCPALASARAELQSTLDVLSNALPLPTQGDSAPPPLAKPSAALGPSMPAGPSALPTLLLEPEALPPPGRKAAAPLLHSPSCEGEHAVTSVRSSMALESAAAVLTRLTARCARDEGCLASLARRAGAWEARQPAAVAWLSSTACGLLRGLLADLLTLLHSLLLSPPAYQDCSSPSAPKLGAPAVVKPVPRTSGYLLSRGRAPRMPGQPLSRSRPLDVCFGVERTSEALHTACGFEPLISSPRPEDSEAALAAGAMRRARPIVAPAYSPGALPLADRE